MNKLADTIRRAFADAQTGRPGPVLVDIPKDVTGAEAEYEYKVPAPIKRKSDQINEETMQEVIGLIEHSVRPFILVGGGVIRADAADELREFVSKVQAPVADTLMGKGAFDGREDAYTGMVGMHGTKTSNYGITESDLLIAIGTRFSDRVLGNVKAFARHADLVHIDVDAAEVNKNVMCKYSIEGDAKVVLQRLNEKLTQQDHEPWMRHIREMKSRYPMTYNHEVLTGPGLSRVFIRQQTVMQSFAQKLGRTRCGLHNFINIRNQDSLFLPAVSEPWAMALGQHLVPSLAVRTES